MSVLNERWIEATHDSRQALLAWLREQDVDPGLLPESKPLKYHNGRLTGYTWHPNSTDTGLLLDDKRQPVTTHFTNPTTSPPPKLVYVND